MFQSNFRKEKHSEPEKGPKFLKCGSDKYYTNGKSSKSYIRSLGLLSARLSLV